MVICNFQLSEALEHCGHCTEKVWTSPLVFLGYFYSVQPRELKDTWFLGWVMCFDQGIWGEEHLDPSAGFSSQTLPSSSTNPDPSVHPSLLRCGTCPWHSPRTSHSSGSNRSKTSCGFAVNSSSSSRSGLFLCFLSLHLAGGSVGLLTLLFVIPA